ncbi:NAD-dependent epimerase/dehydratase family protein [Bacteroidota bacterium]
MSKIRKTCLVTGGAGFIGAHVVESLIEMNQHVIVLDDLSGGYAENIHADATFIQGSIVDHQLVSKIFEEHNIDLVYHLAAYAAEGLSHFIKRFNYNNNLIGSVNLINESVKHGIERFIFTSSIAVYGEGQLPMHEKLRPLPEDPYGIAKYAVEQELKVTNDMFGLDYTIFRPHNVYGEYQNIADRYRNVIGIFMNQILQNKPLTVFGDGNQKRAFSYIGDVAPYIAQSAFNKKSKNQIINIGADQEYTIKELAETVIKEFGRDDVKLTHLPARNEVLDAYANHEKAAQIFNINTYTSLEDGIAKMAKWVNSHGARATPKFQNIELYDKLPPIWLED